MSESQPRLTSSQFAQALSQAQSEALKNADFKIVYPSEETRKAQLQQIASRLEAAIMPAVASGTIDDIEIPYIMNEADIALINALTDSTQPLVPGQRDVQSVVDFTPLKLGLYLRQTQIMDDAGYPSFADYAIVGVNKTSHEA